METHSERFSPNLVKRSSVPSTPTLNTGNNHDDTDIICCSCGDDDDSGFTIQCEECLTWQHGECMNITPARVPRYHICDSCQASPRRHSLRQADGQSRYGLPKQQYPQQQQQRKRKQQLFTSDDSGNNTREVLHNQVILANANDKKKSRDISTNAPTTITDNKRNDGNNYGYGDNMNDNETIQTIEYGHDLAMDSLVKQESAPDASQFIKLDTTPSLTISYKKQLVKRKGTVDALKDGGILKKRVKKETASGNKDLENDANNSRDDDDETVTPYDYSATTATSIEPPKSRRNSTGTRSTRSGGFVQVNRNVIKNKLVKQIMKEAREQWKSSDDETSPAVFLDAAVLLPSIPKVSVRPLWKSLLGNSTSSTRSGKNDPSVRKGVFAEIHVPGNRFLLEINGEISIKSAYKCDLGSLYPLLHTPEDHLFFYPSLDLMIDARSYGNDSRYIRRSCHPNAQVKCVTLAPHGKDDDKDDDQTVHLGLFTLEDVEKGEELSVAWDWQRGTSLWKKYTLWKRQRQQSPQPTAASLADTPVKHMLDVFEKEFGECACEDKDDCFVAYLKDISSSSSSSSADLGDHMNKKGTQRRRLQQSDTPSSNDTRSNGTGQRRRSKDSSAQQPARLTPAAAPNLKQEMSHEPAKGVGKSKRHRSSKSNTSVDLMTINMDAKNDLFFASLPTSRATSPVHSAKLLHSSTEKHGTAPAPTATTTTTTVVDIVCDTANLNKKWKLPCKKVWMKTYLAEMDKTRAAPAITSSKSNAVDGFWDETDAKSDRDNEDDNKIPYLETKHQPGSINETTDNEATTSTMDDLVMDESMGDDSSTATLPLDNSNDMMILNDHRDSSYSGLDKLTTDATTAIPTATATSVPSAKGAHHTTFLATDIHSPTTTTTSNYSVIKVSPSYTDNHNTGVSATIPPPKPVKAKLSLQEYLSMRKKHN